MNANTDLRGWAAYRELAHLMLDPLAATRRLAARGGFVAMRPAFRTTRPPIIHVAGEVYAQHVLKNYKSFENGGIIVKGYRGSVHNRLRKGYFSANGDEYEHYIRIFGPLFRKSVVEDTYRSILDCVDQALNRLPVNEVVNMTAVFNDLMKKLASACMFRDPEPAAGLRAADAVERHGRLGGASAMSLITAKYARPPFSRLHRQAALTYEALNAWGDTRRSCPATADLLSAIVNSPDELGNQASPERIAGYGWTMLGASYDTSTSILSWLIVLLAAHPDVTARLHDELQSASPDIEADLRTIMDLPYLDGVIREALRLIPPAPIQRRKAIIDTEIAGDEIAAGSQILISSWMTNRDPSNYANPERFDPGRWKDVNRSPYQWLSFSAGPRRCLGIWFAFAFLKAILAGIIVRWRPDIPDGARIDEGGRDGQTAAGRAGDPAQARRKLSQEQNRRKRAQILAARVTGAAIVVSGLAGSRPARPEVRMKRLLIFAALYPPLALAVFTAPDGFRNFLDWLAYAYPAAMVPALLTAGVNWKLSDRPAHMRIAGTTFAGAVITGSIAFFLWGGFSAFFPALMANLVGAIPAAVCSWLSAGWSAPWHSGGLPMGDDFERALQIFQEFGPERAIPVQQRWQQAFPTIDARQLEKWERDCRELESFAYGLGVRVTSGELSDAAAAALLAKRYPRLSRPGINRTISQACYFAMK